MQNAVNVAQGRLPNEVKQTGVTVAKNSGHVRDGARLHVARHALGPDVPHQLPEHYVVNDLKRVKGVGDVLIFGERKYAMRLWLDPKRLADQRPRRKRRRRRAAGAKRAGRRGRDRRAADQRPPALSDSPCARRAGSRRRTQFANVVLRPTPTAASSVRDVGRVELGAENYAGSLQFNGKTASASAFCSSRPPTRWRSRRTSATRWTGWRRKFPAGVIYTVAFDTTSSSTSRSRKSSSRC